VSANLKLKAVKTMKIQCKTKETVSSFKEYYQTKHWNNLIREYIQSDLSKLCFKCKKSITPEHFLHRTKTRLGKEKLTDIIPICSSCIEYYIDIKPNRGKKKTERRALAPLGFNEKFIEETQKQWLISISPPLRGYIISKYYSDRAKRYKPSKQWINAQVKKACKWIRKQEKEMLKMFDYV